MGETGPWCRPLEDVLRIDPFGDDSFTAQLDGFGGVTLGCATLAAARTCPQWSLHSLHTYFLRPVPPGATVELVVEKLRDARRFAQRRVQVRLEERLLCELMASFTAPGGGPEYQDALLDPAAPQPEELPSEEEWARVEGWSLDGPGPVGGSLEWRWIGTPWRPEAEDAPSRYRAWVRARFPLPPDRCLNAAALAFLSDYHSHFSVARKLGGPFAPIGFTSLDQLLWVHREVLWDDWWLLTTESDVAHAGRAFTRRMLHARDGRLVASMAQEQLIPGATLPR
jgi:acyl-CoA thioesterase-2